MPLLARAHVSCMADGRAECERVVQNQPTNGICNVQWTCIMTVLALYSQYPDVTGAKGGSARARRRSPVL